MGIVAITMHCVTSAKMECKSKQFSAHFHKLLKKKIFDSTLCLMMRLSNKRYHLLPDMTMALK